MFLCRLLLITSYQRMKHVLPIFFYFQIYLQSVEIYSDSFGNGVLGNEGG
jgi:hypothetical protein